MHEQQKRANGIADRLAALVTGRRAKWVILVAWIVVLAVASPLAARLGDVTNNDAVTWLPESAESAQVARLNDRFDAGDASTAMVVYHREGGITADDQAAIEETREAVASAFPDAELSPPIPSEDGEVLFYTLPLTGERSEIEEDVKALREILAGPPEGLEVAVTGPAGISVDLSGVFDGIDTTLLLASASVVTVLLLIIYRSPFLWVLPLLTVAFASQTATAIVYGMVETIGITVNGQTQGILPILVFGAGTDYALLLIARYREELREEEDTHLAMQRARRDRSALSRLRRPQFQSESGTGWSGRAPRRAGRVADPPASPVADRGEARLLALCAPGGKRRIERRNEYLGADRRMD